MKTAIFGAAVVLVMASATQAAVRSPDVYTDGARAVHDSIPSAGPAQRSQAERLVDEQFRRVAVHKADPYLDGAVRQTNLFTDGALARVGKADPFTDGGLRQVDSFTNGALARIGETDQPDAA
ncbi:hypothetical protein BJN34_26670 [Cupriavidus necator]|uniref:Uncharacterized protein n=1 Tax=Cupriavidus necator TaxID=106590 RepID=A0A1U9UYZ2_CUPNE|nr:hypothetical protein [Cupriavidus necator]AQV97451.1 hypothetical protein BJN34_26670 [Cupriavidus necator]